MIKRKIQKMKMSYNSIKKNKYSELTMNSAKKLRNKQEYNI